MGATKIQKMHYKEKTPNETVERLEKIFSDLGIEFDEKWHSNGEISTPSLRITFKGTSIGQNGKGINESFTRASAYAELIERYSTGIIYNKPLNISSDFSFSKDYDEKYLTAEEIISQNDPLTSHYYTFRGMQELSYEEKVEHFKGTNIVDYILSGNKNHYLCIPFYDFGSGETYYLPYNIIMFSYGSNGMSAGNTPAEALVQSLSEIYERHVQYRILTENIRLPTIPDDYIKRFPYIYKMYKDLQKQEDYTVIMKDCSLGGKYPVAGLLLIQKNTGRYGIKLGCHPDFGVAMERTFTEAAQGRSILEYSTMSTIDFFNRDVDELFNIENSYSVGKAQYPFEVFSELELEQFVPVPDVSNLSNEEILADWLEQIKLEGNEIMIRDSSFMGFPCYQIIIPGISETVILDDSRTRVYNTKAYLMKKLLEPDSMDETDLNYVISTLGYFSKFIIINEIGNTFPFVNKKLPYEDFNIASSLYLSSQCCVQMGELVRAIEYMGQAKHIILGISSEQRTIETERITAEYTYLTALLRLEKHESVMHYLNIFFDKEICKFIDNLYKDPKHILSKQYVETNKEDFTEEQKRIVEIMEKRKQVQLNAKINQESIGDLIGKIIN